MEYPDGLRSTLLMVTEYLLVVILKKNMVLEVCTHLCCSSWLDLNYVESFQLVHSSCYAHVENQIERVRALVPDYQLLIFHLKINIVQMNILDTSKRYGGYGTVFL